MENKAILKPMEIVREYCRLGHKLRQMYNIPVSYPLYEARINICELPYSTQDGLTLIKDERQLIADELNVDWVEPVYTAPQSAYATSVEIKENGYKLSLDITKDHYLDRRYQERTSKRKEAETRKNLGLAYEPAR